jgi:hypothetical protein
MNTCRHCTREATHIIVQGCVNLHITDYLLCEPHNQHTLIRCPQCGLRIMEIISEPTNPTTPFDFGKLAKEAVTHAAYLNQTLITVREAIDQLNLMMPPRCDDQEPCVNHCGTGPCPRKCQTCQRLAFTPETPCPACPDHYTQEKTKN